MFSHWLLCSEKAPLITFTNTSGRTPSYQSLKTETSKAAVTKTNLQRSLKHLLITYAELRTYCGFSAAVYLFSQNMGQFKASTAKKEQQLWKIACMASSMPSVTNLEEATLSAQGYLALLTNPWHLRARLKGDAFSFMSLARGLRYQILTVIFKDLC